jgi:hypothetical protein
MRVGSLHSISQEAVDDPIVGGFFRFGGHRISRFERVSHFDGAGDGTLAPRAQSQA